LNKAVTKKLYREALARGTLRFEEIEDSFEQEPQTNRTKEKIQITK